MVVNLHSLAVELVSFGFFIWANGQRCMRGLVRIAFKATKQAKPPATSL